MHNPPPDTPHTPVKPDSDSSDDQIPSLFATIHFRSEQRPDGYTSDDIELLNIQANRHIPDLYEKLVRQREERIARESVANEPMPDKPV